MEGVHYLVLAYLHAHLNCTFLSKDALGQQFSIYKKKRFAMSSYQKKKLLSFVVKINSLSPLSQADILCHFLLAIRAQKLMTDNTELVTSLQEGEVKFDDTSKVKSECNSLGSWKNDCSVYCNSCYPFPVKF